MENIDVKNLDYVNVNKDLEVALYLASILSQLLKLTAGPDVVFMSK